MNPRPELNTYEFKSSRIRIGMIKGSLAGLALGVGLAITGRYTGVIHSEALEAVLDVCGVPSMGCFGAVVGGQTEIYLNCD